LKSCCSQPHLSDAAGYYSLKMLVEHRLMCFDTPSCRKRQEGLHAAPSSPEEPRPARRRVDGVCQPAVESAACGEGGFDHPDYRLCAGHQQSRHHRRQIERRSRATPMAEAMLLCLQGPKSRGFAVVANHAAIQYGRDWIRCEHQHRVECAVWITAMRAPTSHGTEKQVDLIESRVSLLG